MRSVWAWTAVYAGGVVWGLIKTDTPLLSRIGLALVWPLGPLAFVVTLGVLLVAAAIAFPVFGATLVAGAAIWWALPLGIDLFGVVL